jgi:transcriptional regulator with XRE-family HTH domain
MTLIDMIRKMKLGDRIRFVRQTKGLTQAQLAEKLNYHKAFVNYIENGHHLPNFIQLLKIAKALDITPEELIVGLTYDDYKDRDRKTEIAVKKEFQKVDLAI